MLKNTENSYGLIARVLHWLVGFAIICLLTVGFIMTDMIASKEKWQLYDLHKATGMLVLILVVFRFCWALGNVMPLFPKGLPKWQKTAAHANILLLYLLMFIMPISGFLMTSLSGRPVSFYGLFEVASFAKNMHFAKLANNIHGSAAVLLILLIVMHVLAGLYHHFIRRDNILIRMIRGE